jgi:glyoxylase-like metal-dependent hydrolase (beta-lactamase superfamily II)
VTQLAPGARMLALRSFTLPPATHTNCFILGDEDLVVVDPGSLFPEETARIEQALEALARWGGRLREIWLTHHHADHWASVPALRARHPGVRVLAHPRTADLLRGQLLVDGMLAPDETRVLGALGAVRAIHTPGHASGHLAFHVEGSATLLAGDLMAGEGTVVVDPPDGDMAAYEDSLRRIEDLAPAAVWPAHGPLIAGAAAAIRATREHRRWREACVLEAVRRAGAADLGAVVREAYQDTDPALHGLAARSALATLIKLQAEGRVREAQGRYSPGP